MKPLSFIILLLVLLVTELVHAQQPLTMAVARTKSSGGTGSGEGELAFLSRLEKHISAYTKLVLYPSEEDLIQAVKNRKADFADVSFKTYLNDHEDLIPLAASNQNDRIVFIVFDDNGTAQLHEIAKSAESKTISVVGDNDTARYIAANMLRDLGIERPEELLVKASSNYRVVNDVLSRKARVGVLESSFIPTGEKIRIIGRSQPIPEKIVVTSKQFADENPFMVKSLREFIGTWSEEVKMVRELSYHPIDSSANWTALDTTVGGPE